MLTEDALLLFLSAVRFGRIPKREKQRLLDEMQSYMNSLNESASMEMEVSPPPDAPCSPQKPINEGPIMASYHGDEKPPKMAAGNNNLSTSSFQSSSAPEPALSHTTTAQAQHTVQAEPSNLTTNYHIPTNLPARSNETSTNVDNAKYNFSNQNQCPVTGHLSSQSYAANQNSFTAGDFQNQSSCPWKLNGGAKVLVIFFPF